MHMRILKWHQSWHALNPYNMHAWWLNQKGALCEVAGPARLDPIAGPVRRNSQLSVRQCMCSRQADTGKPLYNPICTAAFA